MKWLKWLFRTKKPTDIKLLQFSPLSTWEVNQMAQARNAQPRWEDARNISPDEHIKYMKIIADQLANVGVIEEGMPKDWYTDDGNGRVDA